MKAGERPCARACALIPLMKQIILDRLLALFAAPMAQAFSFTALTARNWT